MKKFFLLMASVLMIGTFAVSCNPEPKPEEQKEDEKDKPQPEPEKSKDYDVALRNYSDQFPTAQSPSRAKSSTLTR